MRKSIACVCGAIFIATSAMAQWAVFDAANFMKNTISAAESISQTSNLINQYSTQLQQYRTQMMQLQSMNPAAASGLLQKNQSDLQNALNGLSAMKSLYGSVNAVQSSFSSRVETAKKMGLNWDQYVQFEQGRIQRNQDGASARAQEDIRMMERVQRDYEFARETEAKIPETAGTHESMQLMNVQMNRVITQNADLIKALNSSNNGSASANAAIDKAAADQADLERKKRNAAINAERFRGERELSGKLREGYFTK